jgi:NTE family protein
MEQLRELIGDRRIEDLPIAYTAVATDLNARREIWIDAGPLFDAIRASIAIPTLFTPAQYHGRMLVDGGLLNPVPVSPTLRDGTDLTFAVNLNGNRDPRLAEQADDSPPVDRELGKYRAAINGFVEKVTAKLADTFGDDAPPAIGMFEVLNRSFDTMQGAITRLKLAVNHPDLLIEIPRNTCLTYEFYRAAHIIAMGRRQAERALREFRG